MEQSAQLELGEKRDSTQAKNQEFVFVGPPKLVRPSLLIGRRIENKAKFYLRDHAGTVTPTLNAFRENRPTGLSVDVLCEQGIQREERKRALLEAKRVCSLEGHDIVGWCSFPVAQLVRDVSDCINRVVHTPTQTNSNHADVVSQNYLQIVEDSDADRARKAKMVAKLMHEFALSKGLFMV